METQITDQISIMNIVNHLAKQMPACLAQEWRQAMSNVMAEAHKGDLALVWPKFALELIGHGGMLMWCYDNGGMLTWCYDNWEPDTFSAISPIYGLYYRILYQGLGAVSSEEWREAAEQAEQAVVVLTALRDVEEDSTDHYVTVSCGPWGCREKTDSDNLADWARVAAAAARWDVVATIDNAVSAMPWGDEVWSAGWSGGWPGNMLAKYLRLASMLHSQICEMNIDWELRHLRT